MAKIELDISEYDLLRDKSKLLEEALSREKKWSEQVDKLNQEKIEAYQKAKKQIVIRKIVEKREYRIPSNFAVDKLQQLIRMIKANSSFNYTSNPVSYIVSIIDDVMKDKAEAIAMNEETQEFIGLDEFKIQAEEDAFKRLTKDSKKALEKMPVYDKAILENKKLEKANLQLFEQNQKLLTELEASKELSNTRLTTIENLLPHFFHIKEYLKDVSVFNYKSKVKDLLLYFKERNL